MLKVEGLSCVFGDFFLDNTCFEVQKGEYFVLLGKSGAGKTLILEFLCGLLKPLSGRFYLNNIDITNLPVQQRGFGLVYQDHALFPHLSVRQNIAYPLHRKDLKQVDELAEILGATTLLDRKPATLSMGEAQRVALARTLAQKPQIIMLDEPLASLDIQSRASIRSLLRKLNQKGQTIIHVTHDYEEAFALANRVAILENGSIAQIGTPTDVFHNPKSKFVAEFAKIKNFFRGTLSEKNNYMVFQSKSLTFFMTIMQPSMSGCIVFDSNSVIVSRELFESSARNVFYGILEDIEPVPCGFELAFVVENEKIYASVTNESKEKLTLEIGKYFYLTIKSSAIKFIPDEEK